MMHAVFTPHVPSGARCAVLCLGAAGLAASFGVAACYSAPPPDAKTGAPPNVESFTADFATFDGGPPPFIGASGVVVSGGELTVAGSAKEGSTSFPFEVADGNSRIEVDATVPPGANLILGRGRLRSDGQAALAVLFAPPDQVVLPARPSAFLVAIGQGSFVDPASGAVAQLGCGGALGPTYVQRSVGPFRVNTPAYAPSGAVQELYQAPQLASLAAATSEGAVTTATFGEAGTFALGLTKTGAGAGQVTAEAAGTPLFGGPFAVAASTTAGVSMACKLSYYACVEACERGLGAEVLGGACTAADCSSLPPEPTSTRPQPVDFQNREACYQTQLPTESCNTALRKEAPTAVAYRAAVQAVFGDGVAGGTQFFVQLVRSPGGAAPRVRRVSVTR